MKIRIGTRSSLLAMTQTQMVADALVGVDSSIQYEIIQIKTSGDSKQGKITAGFGDKKDWVYELELALLNGQIDIAVHSAKDVPGNTEPGLDILPVLERANPFDIFIGKLTPNGLRLKFDELSDSSVIGTSSLRRKASLHFYNPKFTVLDHRGNVPTRIQKLDDSDSLDGIILACAGVERLNALSVNEYEVLPSDIMLPAMNQGILCAQFRAKDDLIIKTIQKLSSNVLKTIFKVERAVANALEGDCNSAISIFANTDNHLNNKIKLHTRVMSVPLAKQIHHSTLIDSSDDNISKNFDAVINELISLGAKDLV